MLKINVFLWVFLLARSVWAGSFTLSDYCIRHLNWDRNYVPQKQKPDCLHAASRFDSREHSSALKVVNKRNSPLLQNTIGELSLAAKCLITEMKRA